MSPMLENLANAFVTLEASNSRFLKSIVGALDDLLELKGHLHLAKTMLEEGFAELDRKEKQIQSLYAFRKSMIPDENLEEPGSDELDKDIREVYSKTKALNKAVERLKQRQLAIKNLKPIQSSHEVGEPRNLSIVPFENIVDEPKGPTPQIGQGNRKRKAEAWNYFTKIMGENGKSKNCKCNYCFKVYNSKSTTNMRNHITMGRCSVYENIKAANKRILGEGSSSTEMAQINQAKKRRAEMAAGKHVQVDNGILNPNETKNEVMVDTPPPGFPMNQKHANLIIETNRG